MPSIVKSEPKDFSSCGVFGAIRGRNAPKIRFEVALEGIGCVSRTRGSPYGAGFAAMDLNDTKPVYKLKAFIRGHESYLAMRDELIRTGLGIVNETAPQFTGEMYARWIVRVTGTEAALKACIDRTHSDLHGSEGIAGRYYSAGRFGQVWKDIGYPEDVARIEGIPGDVLADLWIGHTRVPTNSLGNPVRSHPFSIIDCFLAHNGELSSFGANRRFLEARGVNSFVGTDSEVAVMLFYHLVKEKGLTVEQAASVLSPPFEQHWDRIRFPGSSKKLSRLLHQYRGAQLDGPYSIIISYADGEDAYLVGLCDRSKFRPMIAGGDKQGNFYIASEEWQIKSVAPDAQVWTPAPGRTVIASVNKGIIKDGRGIERKYFFAPLEFHGNNGIEEDGGALVIDARGKGYKEINRLAREAGGRKVIVKDVKGDRFFGIRMPEGSELILEGIAGNSTNKIGRENTTVRVKGGNAQDDFADASHATIASVEGDVRDVAYYAYQGGHGLVFRNAGNRAGILARLNDEKRPSVLVYGGRADDYFAEFAADSVHVLLGIPVLGVSEDEFYGQIAGNFIASGIVGRARIYIRGKLAPESIGLLPDKDEVWGTLKELVDDGVIDRNLYLTIKAEDFLSWQFIKEQFAGNIAVLEALHPLFWSKYRKELDVGYRNLNDIDRLATDGIRKYCEEFAGRLPPGLLERLLSERYTVIQLAEHSEH